MRLLSTAFGAVTRSLLYTQSILFGCLCCVSVATAGIVQHSGVISAQTTWTADDIHQITGTITVNSGVQLTIEPGTTVKFNNNTALNVNGVLVAIGNASEKIIFTSYRDDSAGGDSNGNGASVGQPGDWQRIYFTNSVTDSLTKLDHVEVRYGGSSTASIYQENANVDITNSVIRDSANDGIYLYYSSALIENNDISNVTDAAIYLANGNIQPRLINNRLSDSTYGIYSRNEMRPVIDGNEISGNSSWGIYFYSASNTPVIQNNTVTGNGASVILPASTMPGDIDNNVLLPNTSNYIILRGNVRSTDLHLKVLRNAGAEINTYRIASGNLDMQASTTLTLDPGVNIKLDNNRGIYVRGAIDAQGTAADRIVLTSIYDDTVGTHTATGVARNGLWYGLYIVSGASSANLAHMDIRYAGTSWSPLHVYANTTASNLRITQAGTTHAIRVENNAQLTLSDSEIYGANSSGIYCYYGQSVTVTNSRIYANASSGLDFRSNCQGTISNSEIFGNAGYGVYGGGSEIIAAENNWWGAADGPGGVGPGSGDAVSANVDYEVLIGDGWLTDGSAFSFLNAGPNSSEGTLLAPVVLSGTSTTEWGTTSNLSALYDLDQVSLSYSGLALDKRYEVLMNVYNADNTSGIGGNYQSLSTAAGAVNNSSQLVDTNYRFYRYVLPASANDAGNLVLNINRDNGYRAAVSRIWLVELPTSDATAPTVSITSPAEGDHLSGSKVNIQGQADDGLGEGLLQVEVGIDDGNAVSWRAVTQLQSDGSWNYQWSLPGDGGYAVHARVTDESGNIAMLISPVNVVVNNTAPAPATAIVASDGAGDSGGQIAVAWQISSDDGTGDNDVAQYFIERSLSGENSFSVVGSISAGNNSFIDSSTVDGIQYSYRIITEDLAGNRSSSAVYGPILSIDNNTAGDTLAPEEVTGLTATAGNESIALSWTGSADSNLDLVDQLLSVSIDGGNNWGSDISLGKLASNHVHTGLTNGQAYRFRLRVKDSSGNVSVGVQTADIIASATAYTSVSGTIASNTEWSTGVYRVTGNITVNAGVTLTIRPGVIVKFNDGRSMTVNGDLIAEGAAGNEIIFTSYRDDSAGGDSNGDGASAGVAGDWYYLRLNSTVTAASRMSYVDVRYGGRSTGSVHLNSATLPISNSRIRFSQTTGLYSYNNNSVISGNTVEDNATSGIYVYNANMDISDNTAQRNQHGIYVYSGNAVISDNTLQDNTGYGLYDRGNGVTQVPTGNTITGNGRAMKLSFAALPGIGDGNSISGNTLNQIEFYGNGLSRSLELSPDILYYQTSGSASINTGVSVRLQPGVIWKFGSNATLNINGALSAIGTDSEKIIFTSYRDDSAGGDSNGNGASIGQPGDWSRMYFSNTVIDFLTKLDHVEVRYGGSSTASIYQENANVDITNSVIRDSANDGIYLYYSSALIENNDISNVTDAAIYLANGNIQPRLINNRLSDSTYGIYSRNEMRPVIDGNEISGNSSWGIYFYSASNTPVIQNNTVTGNGAGVILPASTMPGDIDNNVLLPNTSNYIILRGNVRSTDLHLKVLRNAGAEINTYRIASGNLDMQASTTLTLDPGVNIKLDNNRGIYVRGAIDAQGTAADRIVLTSIYDDTVGTHTATGVARNGLWYGLYIVSGASSANLAHMDIRYAGTSWSPLHVYANTTASNLRITQAGTTHAIRVENNAQLTLSDSEIYGANSSGIYCYYGQSVTVTNSRIYANASSGLDFRSNCQGTISNSEIFGNAGYGVYGGGSEIIVAENNWWGAADGPGGVGPGSGDAVSANVDYEVLIGDGWLADGSAFSFLNAGPNSSEGTLLAPVVLSGTSTTEWGTTSNLSALYDLDQVSLSYSGLALDKRYEVLMNVYNADNTSGIGGNYQSLSTAAGAVNNSSQLVDTNYRFYRYVLPASANDAGNLVLNINRDNGYRAAVSRIWLVELPTSDATAPTVSITSPAEGDHLSGSKVNIQGQADDGLGEGLLQVEVGIDDGNAVSWRAVTQLQSDGSWNYQWSLPGDGGYAVHARVTDESGNIAMLISPVNVVVNNTAPAPATAIVASDGAGDSGGQIAVAWQISSDDGTGDNDVAQYFIERSLSSENSFSVVGSISAGNNSFIDSSTVDGIQYSYRIITEDLAGNRSSSAVYGPILSIDNNTAGDTLAPEEVTGLTATAGNESIALSWTGSADSNLDLVDQLLSVSIDGGNNWGSDISLGKLASNHVHTGLTNGQAYRFRLRVKDSSGNVSVGVQTADIIASATAYTSVSGTIASNTEWSTGVYRVTGNITVNAGVSLTIRPGVIVKFNDGRSMTVNGDLIAEGAAGNEIIFTSYRDDSAGGDSNGDGASAGVAGDWYYLRLNSTVTAASRMSYVDVRYGGRSTGSVHLNSATLPISNSRIRFSQTTGLYSYNNNSVISGNTVEDNATSGIYVYNANMDISDNTAQRNQHGIYVYSGNAVISDNTLQDNTGYGLYDRGNGVTQVPTGNTITGNGRAMKLSFAALPGIGDGNSISGNTLNQIEFYGNGLSRSLELSPDILYYQTSGSASINTGVSVRLQPGVIWKFGSNATLNINGALSAIGTDSEKIIFTSYRDDSAGGDSNGNGASIGQPGDWSRMYFTNTVIDFLTKLDHVEVRYGGSSTASIYQENANVDITNSVIRDSANDGIYLYYSSALIENNDISNVTDAAIYLANGNIQPRLINNRLSDSTYGIYSRNEMRPVIDGNEISGNSSWGIYFYSASNTPVIQNNTVTGNGASVILPASTMPGDIDNNVLLPNTSNYIILRGNVRSTDLHLKVLRNAGAEINTYRIASGNLDMQASTTLTLDPGVNIKLDNNRGIYVRGAIDAQGTAADRIVLTSIYDDTVGTHTATGVARNGLWYGLYIVSGASSANLAHMDIRYAGTSWSPLHVYANTTASNLRITQAGTTHAIRVENNAQLTLSDSEIYGANSSGIYCYYGQSVTVTNSRIYANASSGLDFRSNCQGTISNSEIFGNAGYGVYGGGSEIIVAENNWWGAADGPGGVGPGSGDAVSANVDYEVLIGDGWLADGSAYSLFNAGGTNHEAYGLSIANVSGVASTEWGTAANQSFLFETEADVPVTAGFAGLNPATSYRILVVYRNQDTGSSKQYITDANGDQLYNAFTLSSSASVSDFRLAKSSYSEGSLTLNIHRESGLRTVVSGLFLIEDPVADSTAPGITVTAPADGEFLPAGTYSVLGTASDNTGNLQQVEVGVSQQAGAISWNLVSSFNTDGSWQYRWPVSTDGDYQLRARSLDNAGNQQVSIPINVTVDSTGPQAVSNIILQNLAGGLRVLWTLSADDGAGFDDVVRYEIFRRTVGDIDYVNLGDVTNGVGFFDDASVLLNGEYLYMVRTVDRAGHQADSVEQGPVIATQVNDTVAPEDVTNLTVQVTHTSGSNVSAYLSWAASPNTAGDWAGQRLYISADGGASYGTNAPAFDNAQFVSLSQDKRQQLVTGLIIGESYQFRITALDGIPNESAGVVVSVSPTGAADEYVTLSGTLSADIELQTGVYVISSNLTVPQGKTLTLASGTILKFAAGRNLTVQGNIIATGTDGSPVVFTALTDDSFGGDTNNDGPSEGAPGYWDRIQINNTANAAISRLDHVTIRYAGSGNNGSIYLASSSVAVVNSLIQSGSSHGIYAYDSHSLIQGNTIEDHTNDGIYNYYGGPTFKENVIRGNRHGIYTRYADVKGIRDNSITNNSGYGVYYYDARTTPTLTGNTITDNNIALRVPASALPDDSNTLAPNDQAYVYVLANSLQNDVTLPVWGEGELNAVDTYIVSGGWIVVAVDKILTVNPGVTLKFQSSGINTTGRLIANGTDSAPIIFTSYRDATAGADPDANASELAQPGDWYGLNFNDSLFESENLLNHSVVRYGGGSTAGIYAVNSDITVKNSEISNNRNQGIYVYYGAPTITGNDIWGNITQGIYVFGGSANPTVNFNRISSNLSHGVYVNSSADATLTNNQIYLNRGYGVYNSTSNVLDASNTWWGDVDSSGPYHATTNITGTGDAITNNVSYSPFVTQANIDYAYRNFNTGTSDTTGNLNAILLDQGTLSDEWDSSSLRSDRTMAWHGTRVQLSTAGLAPDKRYKIRVSYFNGDAAASYQSLTDSNANPVHGSLRMPTSEPVQYEFRIPQTYYADGNLSLYFEHDNPATSIRAALPELWLFEDIAAVTPPLFTAISYNDSDGNGGYSVGDTFSFHFSEGLDTTGIISGSTDANDKLLIDNAAIYGTSNTIDWSADLQTVTVTLSEGFTVIGGEQVTPTNLFDSQGNAALGSQILPSVDTVPPAFVSLSWQDNDSDAAVSLGDSYTFFFSEVMNTAVLADGSTDANAHLRPQGGKRYGSSNSITWSADSRSVTVDITSGFTVVGDELVIPGSFITDVTGNSVTGTQYLLGKDSVAPVFSAVAFDDTDGNGIVTLGDRYRFIFNEPMQTSALSDQTIEANLNLILSDGKQWGNLNAISWNNDSTEVTVDISSGFTLTGSETVSASALVTDASGNAVSNSIALTLTDTVAPSVARIVANYISPTSATDTYNLLVQFDSSMNSAVLPQIVLSSTGAQQPVVTDGEWLTTFYPNDTYITGSIALSQGMDGQLSASVSVAEDWAGNVMAPAIDVFSAELDATPPVNPVVTVRSQTCQSATLDWNGYSAPADLTGYQVYSRTDGAFTQVDGHSYILNIDPSSNSVEVKGLAIQTAYELAVVAMDHVGNITPTVISHSVFIPLTIPASVNATVGSGAHSDSAVIDWSSYSSSNYCGFGGYYIYVENTDFVNVDGLSPVATLSAADISHELSGLDRSQNYYIAVVGFNAANQFVNTVNTVMWSDPYAGAISTDTTIGSGDETIVDITETITVTNNATLNIAAGSQLRFAAGTGIMVLHGALTIEGSVFEPVVLTSANAEAGTAAAGDWAGITLSSGAIGSSLRHVVIEYGQGLTLDGSSATVEAFTALHNNGAGLTLRNGASLTTTSALLRYNDVGINVENNAVLNLSQSVIKNNDINAQSDGSVSPNLQDNWWGSLDEATILNSLGGTVDSSNFLTYEPVLTPAISTSNGDLLVVTQNVSLLLPGRNADEMRLSEDATFLNVFFDPWQSQSNFALSANVGEKIVYAQFRSVTGTISETVSVTLNYVTEGPEISNVSLADGQIVSRPIMVTANANAVLGLERIELLLDNTLLTSVTSNSLSYLWDPRNLANSTYSLVIRATDLAGHITQVSRTIIVELAPADAPVITTPVNGSVLNVEPITIQGNAEPGVQVYVRRNGFVVGTPIADINTGNFVVPNVSLQEGDSTIYATANDTVGISAQSAVITVTLDTGAPSAVQLSGFSNTGSAGNFISWAHPGIGEQATNFYVYRSSQVFADPSQAQLLTATGISDLFYNDTPAIDGTYFYGIIGEDSAGNRGSLSNVLVIVYDRSNPQLAISYDKTSPVGQGILNITLTSNEALLRIPGLTLTPANSNSPQAVILTAQDETTFIGTLDISQQLNSGDVLVNAVATDQYGNQFTGAPTGDSLYLDTVAPVGSILVNPAAPVQVQTATDLNISVSLNEAMKAGSLPALQFMTPAGTLATVPLLGSGSSWSGVITLDSSAGDGAGSFSLSTEDAQGNMGGTISSGKTLELYTGDLPVPAAVPAGLLAVAQPGGLIALSWSAAENAESYRIYRRAGDCSVTPDVLVASGISTISSDDLPVSDGDYCYAVSSERLGAESALSTPVPASSDRVAPGSAQNLAITLQNNGVIVSWNAPSGEIPVQYIMKRDGAPVRTLPGGEPSYSVQEHPGTGGIYQYTVVSLDAAGNSSTTAPEDFALLVGAVSNLQAIVMHGEAPTLAWTNNDANVVGYEVYSGDYKLHGGLLTTLEFQDSSYAGQRALTYGVVAVDNLAQRSPMRNIAIHPVQLDILANPDEDGNGRVLLANNFSRFTVSVANLSTDTAVTIDKLTMEMSVNAVVQHDETRIINQSILAQQQLQQELVLPIGNTDEDHLLLLTATRTDISDNRIYYQRPVLFENVLFPQDMISISLNDVPLAGGYTTVQLCVKNPGYTAIEIIAAREKGQSPGDLYASILDEQGLEIARGEYQGIPSGAQLRGTDIIVVLDPKEQMCVDIQVLVPEALDAGTQLSFVGSINEIQHTEAGETITAGSGGIINGSTVSGITQSTYYGIAQTDKAEYSNDETVIITGQAINRLSGLPEANTAIKIGFETRGYTWFEALTTDVDGNFSMEYMPVLGLGGQFQIWAAHPDVYDILNQGSFSFHRMYASPASAEIRSSKADTLNFEIDLINPGEHDLDNLGLIFRAYTVDTEGNEIDEPRLQGMLNTAVDWSVAPGESEAIKLSLTADIDAPTNINVEYALSTAQGASVMFTATVNLSEAIPLLDVVSPTTGYLDTSLNSGSVKTVPITITNRGLRDLENAVLTLPDTVSWIGTTIAETGNNQVQLGNIAVGESLTFDVLFTPPAGTSYGYHEDSFVISGSNAVQDFVINVYALVSSSETGSVQFNVFNILAQEVPNARVRIWNHTLEQEINGNTTDVNGQVVISDLKLGDWGWQVVASGHYSATGTIRVEADIIAEETVELDKNLVTITFSVVPVPYTDRYEIVVEQTFVTHVPVPLLIMDPPYTLFENVAPGFEIILPISVSNFGLKALDNVKIAGQQTGTTSFTPLIEYLPRLGAMETVVIPFKIKHLGDADAVSLPNSCEGDGGGGGGSGDGDGNLPNFAETAMALAGIVSGSTSSYFSQAEKNAIAKALVGVMLIADIKDTLGKVVKPNAKDVIEAIAKEAAKAAGTAIGGAISGGSSCGDGGGGDAARRTTSVGNGSGGDGCFVAGTPIQLADGSLKRIEQVVMGDRILGFDGHAAGVTKVYVRETDHLRELRYRDVLSGQLHRVETTDEHLFWSQKQQNWLPAGELKVGDVLVLSDNQFAVIESTNRREIDTVVYNFDVENLQSYYANDALVYQQCGADTDPAVTQLLLETQNINLQRAGRENFQYLPQVDNREVTVR